MTNTYTGTIFNPDLTKATIKLYVHEAVKWEAAEEDEKVATYRNVKAWSIVNGEDAEEIEKYTDESCIDELHEYLVLHFADGETATYRNSHVEMFIR